MLPRWCPLTIVLSTGLGALPLHAEELPGVERYGDRVVVQKDIAFSKEGLAHQKLDLYVPKGDGPFPVVVCWFGGGFTGGNKSGMARVCAFLADKGIAAAAPGYYPADPKQDKPGWPQNVNDAKCAVRFLRANARMYHLDPERIAGLGHSSGAYLAMMVGFTPGLKDLEGQGGFLEQASKLAAVVNIAGVSDRRGALGTGTQNLLGKGYQDKPDLRKLASPIAHIARDTVPVYTLHGEEDKTVLPASARQLDAALKAAGVEHELQIVPKLGHNPIAAETMAPVAAWLAAKLKKEAAQPKPDAAEGKAERWQNLERALAEYRQQLNAVRKEHGGTRKLPAVPFFLFGMGDRQKLLYRQGVLRDARTGKVLRQWEAAQELIVPPACTVALKTKEGQQVFIDEDQEAVWLEEKGERTALSKGRVTLPGFAGHRYPAVLRVLHQELLVNVVDGKPLPNFFVYAKPWYRDGAMMAMAFQKTGNLHLVQDWILGLREPYDRNNNGETEADNLGQALYLISLVSDKSHPLVGTVQKELKRFEKGKHIEGRSDFALHPVYQTKWAKFGRAALGLEDRYEVPQVADSYAALFWWQYKDGDKAGQSLIDSADYPYLAWAGAHYTGQKKGKLSDQDYPLTWEAKASQADYAGLKVIDPVFAKDKLSAPHTWHAAEAFLFLLEEKDMAAVPDQVGNLKKLGARITLDDKNRIIAVNLGEQITDADLTHLQGLTHLQELDLTRTRITSAGLVHLKNLTTLKKLFLTDTKVDDAGLGNLKEMKALETLGLSGTKIGDPALTHLQGLTALKSLFCIGTGVSDAGVQELQKALPECRVAH